MLPASTMLPESVASLPKAELHLHLEGSIQPGTVCALTARRGVVVSEQEVRRRYAYQNFSEFLEAFKWVTSFLRDPQDYALITRDLAEHLLSQRVIYAEVTISIGVMLLRKQRPERKVYDQAAGLGLHRLIHAGEIGGPEKIREAVELLGAERIGHGIAAINDPALMDLLADRRIPLEICPQSNIRTGALARQLRRAGARIEDHPLAKLFRHGIPIVLSTDDPAMFHTTLLNEYEHAQKLGMTDNELLRLAQMSFDFAFERPHSRTAG